VSVPSRMRRGVYLFAQAAASIRRSRMTLPRKLV
jgi:hypothetical protein